MARNGHRYFPTGVLEWRLWHTRIEAVDRASVSHDVGYTTWSGNERMIRVGYKLGMTMEARLRKCRLYQGVYYDSIRMGILREEWEQHIQAQRE